jgi:hypothetical protein
VTGVHAEGFVFVELYVEDPRFYARIFEALGFAVVRAEEGFMELRSSRGLILLNAFEEPEEGHPFEHYREQPRRGLGVEIGIVTEKVREAWEAVGRIEGCTTTPIVEQDWGMTDFRILTPAGYYLRVTTPPRGS